MTVSVFFATRGRGEGEKGRWGDGEKGRRGEGEKGNGEKGRRGEGEIDVPTGSAHFLLSRF
jgi:hypothetical protein